MDPLILNFPSFFLISLKIECKKVVFPLATLPTTATNSPVFILRFLISNEFFLSELLSYFNYILKSSS